MQLYIPVRITATALSTAAGQQILNSGFDAPRSWPISSAIETISATINNQAVSINLADVAHPLLDWYNSEEPLRAQDWSTTPVFPDQSQSYAQLTGTMMNPLADIGNAIPNHEMPRGSFTGFSVVQNQISTAAGQVLTAIWDCAFAEFLLLQPFAFGKGCSTSGLINVTTLDINISMVGNAANRFWSHCPPAAGPFPPANNQLALQSTSFVFGGTPNGPDSFSSGSGSQPYLLVTYITPKDTMMISPNIPITYEYSEVVRHFTQQQAYADGFGGPAQLSKNVVMSSNNIQLSQWPQRLYIMVREQNQDLYSSMSKTDTYSQINSVSLTVGNKNGLLASMNPVQLFQMSCKNGYQGSWTQWNGTTSAPGVALGGANFPATNPPKQPQTLIGLSGSILCCEFATDIGLDSLQAPGKLEQTQLQVQLTVTNINPAAITPVLLIILVNSGTFTVQRLGSSTINTGVLSSQNILDAKQMPGISLKDVESNTGGDLFSGLKDIGKWIKSNKILSTIVGPGLGLLGMIPGPQSLPLKALSALGTPAAAAFGYGGRRAPAAKPAPRRRMRQGRIGYGAGEDDGYGDDDDGYGRGGEEITNEQLSEHIDY